MQTRSFQFELIGQYYVDQPDSFIKIQTLRCSTNLPGSAWSGRRSSAAIRIPHSSASDFTQFTAGGSVVVHKPRQAMCTQVEVYKARRSAGLIGNLTQQ